MNFFFHEVDYWPNFVVSPWMTFRETFLAILVNILPNFCSDDLIFNDLLLLEININSCQWWDYLSHRDSHLGERQGGPTKALRSICLVFFDQNCAVSCFGLIWPRFCFCLLTKCVYCLWAKFLYLAFGQNFCFQKLNPNFEFCYFCPVFVIYLSQGYNL